MLVGVPKEIKNHEYRVGLTPAAVKEFVSNGHQVLVETLAGDAIGFSDDMYIAAGAAIVGIAAVLAVLIGREVVGDGVGVTEIASIVASIVGAFG